ncbi:hypothetical protein KY363_05735, partial [Candidatus Woesearchaeota archaeon]|nr:hypothetical protein [Candidatus Woesearchaeota archaeon]
MEWTESQKELQETTDEKSVFVLALKELLLVILLCVVAVFLLFFNGFTGNSVLEMPMENVSSGSGNLTVDDMSAGNGTEVFSGIPEEVSLNDSGNE